MYQVVVTRSGVLYPVFRAWFCIGIYRMQKRVPTPLKIAPVKRAPSNNTGMIAAIGTTTPRTATPSAPRHYTGTTYSEQPELSKTGTVIL